MRLTTARSQPCSGRSKRLARKIKARLGPGSGDLREGAASIDGGGKPPTPGAWGPGWSFNHISPLRRLTYSPSISLWFSETRGKTVNICPLKKNANGISFELV